MNANKAKYVGEDYWGRPTFKCGRNYYCLLDLVYGDDAEGKKLAQLIETANQYPGLIYSKGQDVEGEPDGPVHNVVLESV